MRRRAALLSALSLTLAGCGGPVQSHLALAGSTDPLRPAFNADSGRVRAILLASPT